MTGAVVLFISQFLMVFLLVVQSINNNHGRQRIAALTSIGIGVAQLFAYKILPDAGVVEMAAFVLAGPSANLAAQWVKRSDIARIRALHDE